MRAAAGGGAAARGNFAGTRRDFDLPLHLQGTQFQQRVWRALTEIRTGNLEYGELAKRIGISECIAAVGSRTPQSHFHPGSVHRVIGADGSLTGYGGGCSAAVAARA